MDLDDVPRTRPGWPELVLRLQRVCDAIAVGTIITDAWEYRFALRFELEYPAGLNATQRAEIERLVDNAQVASAYL